MTTSLDVVAFTMNTFGIIFSLLGIKMMFPFMKRPKIKYFCGVQILNIASQTSLIVSFLLHYNITNPLVLGNENPIFSSLSANDAAFLFFKNLGGFGCHATILTIGLCNLEILDCLKVLLPYVTVGRIRKLRIGLVATYLALIIPQWIACFLPIINIRKVIVISLWWSLGTIIWPGIAIIFSNIQALIQLINRDSM